jgi:signal transduction histidine kinase
VVHRGQSGTSDRDQPDTEDRGRLRSPRKTDTPPAVNLHTLKIAGVVLPVTCVIISEIARFALIEADLYQESNHQESTDELTGHILLASIMIAAMIGFATAMFHFINRIQGRIVRQNRQLAALNAVSTAVRADLTVDEIVASALDSILLSTGAAGAEITLTDGSTYARSTPGPDVLAGCSVTECALTAGTSPVGTLHLTLPADEDCPGPLTFETLQTIGQQLGHAIQRALLIANLERGHRESEAFHEVVLQISGQRSLARTLQTIATFARDRLSADEATLLLDETASRIVRVDAMLSGPPLRADGLLRVTPNGVEVRPAGPTGGPADRSDIAADLVVPLGSSGAGLGDLWIGRRAAEPFDEPDRRFLATLAELTTISLNDARMLEGERQGAVLAERERIARELHDSLAQVLGATHLRLQALRAKPAVRNTDEVHAEVSDLVEICHDAYADVREAILGLGQSSRAERHLLDSLRAYLKAFTRQSGVAARLESSVDADLALVPRGEVQVVRIVQEALTNVRKHSGASRAIVRVTDTASSLVFTVEDDGHGFSPDAVPVGHDGFGFGLASMSERARLLGATLRIDSAPGRGTCVRVDVPSVLVLRRLPAKIDDVVPSRGA